MPEEALALHDLRRTFNPGTPHELRALQGVSLSLELGSFVIVVGSNGSGKSTLLNAIAGAVQVDSGSILLSGRDVTRWPEHRRARMIGRVFQNPFTGTAAELSVGENLALAARRGGQGGLHWMLGKAQLQGLKAALRRLKMGLEDRLDIPVALLSGGQRQALTLLMATLLPPAVLLLDEHTAALDPRSAEQVLRLTHEIVLGGGLTTLMVTHSLQQAVRLGDRVVMMHRGRVVHDFRESEKRRLRVEDLLDCFEHVRAGDLLDESAAEMLQRTYV